MKFTKEEAQAKYPGVVFSGQFCVIGTGAVIRAGAVIGEGAVIGAGAVIGTWAIIRAGADIRAGAVIATVCAKYTGNIIPMPDRVLIRIGCEIHPIEEWKIHGQGLAKRYDETDWWNQTGNAMLGFLTSEAKGYLASGSKRP